MHKSPIGLNNLLPEILLTDSWAVSSPTSVLGKAVLMDCRVCPGLFRESSGPIYMQIPTADRNNMYMKNHECLNAIHFNFSIPSQLSVD